MTTDKKNDMREFLAYHHHMLALMFGVCVVAAAVLYMTMRNDIAWCGGFVAGAVAQLAKFGWVDVAVVRKIAVEGANAAATQMKAMGVTLVLFGLAVFVVYRWGFNVWAMAAGIFLPRILLIADAYLRPNPFGTSDPDQAEAPEHNPDKVSLRKEED